MTRTRCGRILTGVVSPSKRTTSRVAPRLVTWRCACSRERSAPLRASVPVCSTRHPRERGSRLRRAIGHRPAAPARSSCGPHGAAALGLCHRKDSSCLSATSAARSRRRCLGGMVVTFQGRYFVERVPAHLGRQGPCGPAAAGLDNDRRSWASRRGSGWDSTHLISATLAAAS